MKKAKMPSPPPDLSKEMRAFWRQINSTFVMEPWSLKTLADYCRQQDRATKAREVLAAEGATYTDKHGVIRSRPEIAAERQAIVTCARLLRELRLDVPAEESRLPRLAGRGG